MKKFIIALTIFSSIAVPLAAYRVYLRSISTGSTDPSPVLGASTESEQIYFNVNVPAIFNRDIKAPNVVYTIRAGEGITLSGEAQTPTINNTGILELVAGTGISVFGNEITSTITQGITSLSAGSGISVDGNKITNSGITSLTAGTGISISGSTITNTYSFTPDYTEGGWTVTGTTVGLTTTTNSVVVDGLTFGNATITNGNSILPDTD